jgi:hypothetical protein
VCAKSPGAEQSDRRDELAVLRRQEPQPLAERNVFHRQALAFLDKEHDHGRRQQSRQQRPGEERPVVVACRFEEEQRRERPDDRADRVHRALQTEGAAVGGARHRGGEQCFPHRRAMPRPSHAPARAKSTCQAFVASAKAPVPSAVIRYPATAIGFRRWRRSV